MQAKLQDRPPSQGNASCALCLLSKMTARISVVELSGREHGEEKTRYQDEHHLISEQVKRQYQDNIADSCWLLIEARPAQSAQSKHCSSRRHLRLSKLLHKLGTCLGLLSHGLKAWPECINACGTTHTGPLQRLPHLHGRTVPLAGLRSQLACCWHPRSQSDQG